MTGAVKTRKKLIEVALPLEAINKESLHRKQKAPKGWPTSFHKWWAQRPLAAARAVIFSQVVDDPSSVPELFPTEEAQDEERQRLVQILKDLVMWDNTGDELVLRAARTEIRRSWQRACADYACDSQTRELFNPEKLPLFCDPFAGSGALPLSAQWLGFESYASDLNPVAVLINKAMIEIPPKFVGMPPVNPEARKDKRLLEKKWHGAEGLAEDVRYYSKWMRDEAEKRIGHLYPKVEITAEMAKDRPDLKSMVGQKLTVVAWLWARTVKSPNPAFAQIDIPLASTFVLSTKAGKEAYVQPIIESSGYSFSVRIGKPKPEAITGTSAGKRQAFKCLMSGVPVGYDYIRSEAKSGRMGEKLMVIVAEGRHGRVYLPSLPEMEAVARKVRPEWKPDCEMPKKHRDFKPPGYGMYNLGDIFTGRQLAALTTFSDLVQESHRRVNADTLAAGMQDDNSSLRSGGIGATAYAEAISVYLACVLDRMAYYGSSLTSWLPKDNALRDCMPRQVLAMTWDFAECNPLGKSSGDVLTCSNSISNYLQLATPFVNVLAEQRDAQTLLPGKTFIFSTDPPYYDNISYADLSDFFYVWLRRALKPVFPELFATLSVPKGGELVASPYRHGSEENAEAFFLDGMTRAMEQIANHAYPGFPVTIYYAFRQSETDEIDGTVNTGWDTFLDAVIRAGFSITGTWPMRTEGAGRMIASGTNALASSIVLVCRQRPIAAPIATRREFANALQTELPAALKYLQRGNIAPVDLAQAAIGPGMAIFTRYSKVIDAEGKPVSVRDALALINQTLDEVLAEQEGDFDGDTRWALAWFEHAGFDSGEYGVAETLSKAKNTSVQGMKDAGILDKKSPGGKVRLLRPTELPPDWDPTADQRLTVWEMVHHLIRRLEAGGESAAAELLSKLGGKAEAARELAYRLYTLCERKKRAQEALSYNALVQSWPEISRLARQGTEPRAEQAAMFAEK